MIKQSKNDMHLMNTEIKKNCLRFRNHIQQCSLQVLLIVCSRITPASDQETILVPEIQSVEIIASQLVHFLYYYFSPITFAELKPYIFKII